MRAWIRILHAPTLVAMNVWHGWRVHYKAQDWSHGHTDRTMVLVSIISPKLSLSNTVIATYSMRTTLFILTLQCIIICWQAMVLSQYSCDSFSSLSYAITCRATDCWSCLCTFKEILTFTNARPTQKTFIATSNCGEPEHGFQELQHSAH